LPIAAFKGIAARAIDDGTGGATVTLELHHHDVNLCIPLLIDTELHTIAHNWRAWSKAYNIPMLMVEADGIARPLDANMARINDCQDKKRIKMISGDRRRYSIISYRRPRFLMRRKKGNTGCRMKLLGHEIIARD